jgi:hypothetical protein
MNWNVLLGIGGGLLMGYVMGVKMAHRDTDLIVAWWRAQAQNASDKLGEIMSLSLTQQEALEAQDLTIQSLAQTIHEQEAYIQEVGELFDGLLNIPLEKGGDIHRPDSQ